MSSYFKLLKSLGSDVLYPAFHEFMRSLPDSLMLGTGVFAMITQSYPLGVLVIAILELCLVQSILGGFIRGVQGGNAEVKSDTCTPGIPSPYQISIVGKVLAETTFPSGPIFLVSGVLMYCVASAFNFTDELKELSKTEPEWNIRIPLAVSFSSLFLILFTIWRVYNSCDGAVAALGSVVLGGLFGGLVYLLHVYLFGRDSINFLGVPLLASRAAKGRPLYACAKQQKTG